MYDDDDDLRDAHLDGCNVWTTNHLRCNCGELRSPHLPRLTTAQRLDLLVPAAGDYLQEGA